MTSTHALVGALLGAATAWVAPDLAPATAAGAAGGALPDADLVATHRRSLHFPVGYGALACLTAGVALLAPTPLTVVVAVFVLAAALHCLMDVLGSGVEARPWEATSERGVYNHLTGRWIRPRRWVRYAGAPEDFLLATAVALPLAFGTAGRARTAIAVVWLCSGVFALFRRRLTAVSERLVD